MYTMVDSYWHNGGNSHTDIEKYFGAYPNQPTLPNSTIDHVEVIIPTLGLTHPEYSFNLTCSAFVNDSTI